MPDTLVTGVGKGGFPGTGATPYVSGGRGKVNLIREGGQNFDAIIDATTISVMGQGAMGVQELPRTNTAGTDSPNVSVETKEWKAAPRDYSTETGKGSEQTEGTDTGSADAAEEIAGGLNDAVREAGEQLIPKTAEEMQVDVQTVIDIMGDLNMTEGDLLTEEGLKALVSAIAGEDETALITDSSLYEKLTVLSEEAKGLAKGITETFNLTPEELAGAIDAGATTFADGDEVIKDITTEIPVIVTENETDTADMADAAVNPRTEATADTEITVAQAANTKAAAAEQAETPDEAAGAGKDFNAVPRTEQQTETGNADRGSGGNTGENAPDGRRLFDGTATANRDVTAQPETNIYATLVNRVNEALNNTAAAATQTPAYTQTVNAEDVIRQVMDFMRINLQPDMTEMELQLNPQSLGKVNVHLASMQNGDIVARFATENEAVKAALENQMPELQKRFQEQGIKVNSVEVTVDQRAFDGNADRQMNRQDQMERQGEELRRAGRLRRVSLELNGLDEEALESLSDEDRITVEMMEAEGNTVNYRA